MKPQISLIYTDFLNNKGSGQKTVKIYREKEMSGVSLQKSGT